MESTRLLFVTLILFLTVITTGCNRASALNPSGNGVVASKKDGADETDETDEVDEVELDTSLKGGSYSAASPKQTIASPLVEVSTSVLDTLVQAGARVSEGLDVPASWIYRSSIGSRFAKQVLKMMGTYGAGLCVIQEVTGDLKKAWLACTNHSVIHIITREKLQKHLGGQITPDAAIPENSIIMNAAASRMCESIHGIHAGQVVEWDGSENSIYVECLIGKVELRNKTISQLQAINLDADVNKTPEFRTYKSLTLNNVAGRDCRKDGYSGGFTVEVDWPRAATYACF